MSVSHIRRFPFLNVQKKIAEYITNGMWMDYHDNMIPSAPETFYRKINAKTIRLSVDSNVIQNAIQSLKIDIHNRRILLLAGSVVASGRVDADTYTLYINEIIKIIGKDRLIVKCHPRFNDLYGEEKSLPSIPSYLPGNVLFFMYDTVIGYNSLLLVEAARIGKTSISLLRLIPSCDEDIKMMGVNYLEERLEEKGKILYPENFEDLSNYLSLKETVQVTK